MKLILWDIDGTMVDCGGQARRSFAEALLEVVGKTDGLDSYDMSGKLDPRIVMDLLMGIGLSREEAGARLPDVREAYLSRLDHQLDGARMRVYPGVLEILEHQAARDDIAMGLLTGNWERGGRIKLSRFDLNRYFAFGSFGDDGMDRRELPPLAMARAAAQHGREFAAKDTLIIGDSLFDIECAHAHGIRCLAVATGRTPIATLATVKPDWLEEDLSAAIAHPAFTSNLAEKKTDRS